MKDKFNKISQYIEELYKSESINPEVKEVVNNLYEILHPKVNKHEQTKENNDVCPLYIPGGTCGSGWNCVIYAMRCDGLKCKAGCDYYNKTGVFK